jgi:hypothetical protein
MSLINLLLCIMGTPILFLQDSYWLLPFLLFLIRMRISNVIFIMHSQCFLLTAWYTLYALVIFEFYLQLIWNSIYVIRGETLAILPPLHSPRLTLVYSFPSYLQLSISHKLSWCLLDFKNKRNGSILLLRLPNCRSFKKKSRLWACKNWTLRTLWCDAN